MLPHPPLNVLMLGHGSGAVHELCRVGGLQRLPSTLLLSWLTACFGVGCCVWRPPHRAPHGTPPHGSSCCCLLLQISRVAPGNLGLHTLQQPLAAACWLSSTMHPDARLASFSSWRYRNPAVLSHAGLVASVTEVGGTRLSWRCVWRAP
jgi:hypothetical protein